MTILPRPVFPYSVEGSMPRLDGHVSVVATFDRSLTMKSKSRPKNCTRLTAYSELQQYAEAFRNGHLNLLIVLGTPGVGKSHALREQVGDQACWISGSATPFGVYVAAYRHCDRAIVLDDIDGLIADRQGVRLLKALTQTDPEKLVSWQSHSTALERLEVPQSFKTASSVAIIGNTWCLSEDIRALEDRGHVIAFEPSPIEVHRRAATFFWDQEIFDFIGANLHLFTAASLRTYIVSWQRKQAGLPWRSVVLERCLSGVSLEVAKLKADPRFSTEADRVKAFMKAGLGCRATYFNHARRLQPPEDVPRIVLTEPAPARQVSTQERLIDFLKRRHGDIGRG
jgi:hypothetical protein